MRFLSGLHSFYPVSILARPGWRNWPVVRKDPIPAISVIPSIPYNTNVLRH